MIPLSNLIECFAITFNPFDFCWLGLFFHLLHQLALSFILVVFVKTFQLRTKIFVLLHGSKRIKSRNKRWPFQ